MLPAWQGIDFFFASRAHAVKFVDFLQSVVPIRYRHDKQLVGWARGSAQSSLVLQLSATRDLTGRGQPNIWECMRPQIHKINAQLKRRAPCTALVWDRAVISEQAQAPRSAAPKL